MKRILSFIIALVFLWSDIQVSFNIEPLPSRPSDNRESSGLSVLYQIYKAPDSVPAGATIDEAFIAACLQPTLDYIDGRYDCADFSLIFLLRLYNEYSHLLPESSKAAVKKTILGFKYWMDEPGEDSMCFWSENHQMMFAVCEYLAGQLWPEEIFTNNLMTGEEHRQKALERNNIWLEQRFDFGFSEWYTNCYYHDDLTPMANYIQFSNDKDSVERMKIVMDLLWFDVATHSVNNTFVAPSSRMYANNKSSDTYGNSIKDEMKVVWKNATTRTLIDSAGAKNVVINGVTFRLKLFNQKSLCFSGLYDSGLYKVPDVIKKIGEDKTPAVIKASSGLSADDMEREGLIGQDVNQIMAQFGAETFTHHKVIENSLEYMSKNKMLSNEAFNPFKYMNVRLFRLLKIPETTSKYIPLMPNGTALGRGNVYFYRTPYYSLSTAVALNVDSCGAQAHIWSANIAPELALYTTQPARDDEDAAKYNASPGYWIGNGRQPMSVQDESINITIYKIPKTKRLLESYIADISHAYVPKTLYDRLEINGSMLFGQKGSVLVAMIANGPLVYRPYNKDSAGAVGYHKPAGSPASGEGCEFDLVRQGGDYHTYITEFSDTGAESFEDFKARIEHNAVKFGFGKVEYKSKNKVYRTGYGKAFTIDGQTQPLEYKRFDSPYATTERKADVIAIRYGGETLTLDLTNMIRETGR